MIKANEVGFHQLIGENKHAQIRVPDYQRGYSWDSENVKDFFSDITTFVESTTYRDTSQAYFLGPTVLMPGPRSDDYSYIVDGQQRMATFIILIAVIRDLSLELLGLEGMALADEIQSKYLDSFGPKEGRRYSVLLGDLDQPFFQAFVQKRNRVENQIPRNKSNGLIKKARNQIEKNLREKIDPIGDKIGYFDKLFHCITNRVVMIAIMVDGEREAMDVFERINVRGKPLSEADLIRHRLISSSTIKDRARVRRCWDDLEKLLGTDGPTMDVFLRHMWISRYGEIKASKLYDEISQHLDKHNTTPLEFAGDCVNDCRIYSVLLNKEDKNLHFESRQSVWVIVTTFGVKQALPLLLSAYRRFEKTPDFSLIAKAVESLVIRHQFFAGLEPNALYQVFNSVALEIKEARSKDNAIKALFRDFRSIDPDVTQLVYGIRQPMSAKKLQAIYVLRQLEDYFSHSDGALMAHATLEHIFPEKALPPKWSNGQIERLNPFLNHIGNLALLSGSGNSSAGNKSFSRKKHSYKQSSLRLTVEIATEFQSWGRAQLLRRAERLAWLADERWRLENKS